MLTPEFLQDIADSLVNGVYRELQEDILKDIIRRILKADFSITDTAKWQAYKLQESGMLYKEILKEIAKATNKSVDEVKQLFEEAAIENLYSVDNVEIEDPVEFLKASEGTMDILKAGWAKTNNTLLNFTLSTAESVQAAYFSAVDIAYLQVNSGAFSYNTAIYNAVKSVIESGAPIVTYPSGHRDQVDVAVRRAVMTGISNTGTRVMLNLADELELDYVDVSAHAGARPSHAEWQGKRYCISGKDKRFPHFETATKFGQGDGLGGWNCRHSVNLTTADSPPMYTAYELDNINNKKVTYDGEEMSLYDATQLQRKMEREMRKDRREVVALNEIKGQSDAAQARFSKVSQRIKEKERTYEDFSKQTGLATQKERLRVVGYNRSVSAKVRWEERKRNDQIVTTALEHIDYNKKNGIISTGKQFGKKIGKHAKDYGLSPSIPEHREQMRKLINEIVISFDELRIGQFRSQPDEVFFYIKGQDVVIMNKDNEFVTIMKGGVENVRVKNSRIIDI
jgi:hypothetical protein